MPSIRSTYRTALAVVVIAVLFPSLAQAQRLDRFRATWSVGSAVLLPGTRFADAYDTGGLLGLALAVRLGPRVWLRAGFERDWSPYDRFRFFRRMGVDQVDLSGQFAEGADVDWWFVGPEVALWQLGPFSGYSLATVGRAVRRATGLLVWMYCTPHTMFAVDAANVIRSVTYTPPASCAEALQETGIGGSAWGMQLGTGLRYADSGRSYLFMEFGVGAWLLQPAMTTAPIRVGGGIGF